MRESKYPTMHASSFVTSAQHNSITMALFKHNYSAIIIVCFVAVMERLFEELGTRFTGCYCCREVAVAGRLK